MRVVIASLAAGAVMALAPASAQRPPLKEAEGPVIEYANVAEARKALDARSDVDIKEANGWHIVVDEAARTVWSFTSQDHPAHPAVVKRQVVPSGTGASIKMSVRCEASKQACDDLVVQFGQQLDKAFPRSQ